jgi:hypothetical protein
VASARVGTTSPHTASKRGTVWQIIGRAMKVTDHVRDNPDDRASAEGAGIPARLIRVARQAGGRYSVSVPRRDGEIDTIWRFKVEHDALGWIKEKSESWLLDQNGPSGINHKSHVSN